MAANTIDEEVQVKLNFEHWLALFQIGELVMVTLLLLQEPSYCNGKSLSASAKRRCERRTYYVHGEWSPVIDSNQLKSIEVKEDKNDIL